MRTCICSFRIPSRGFFFRFLATAKPRVPHWAHLLALACLCLTAHPSPACAFDPADYTHQLQQPLDVWPYYLGNDEADLAVRVDGTIKVGDPLCPADNTVTLYRDGTPIETKHLTFSALGERQYFVANDAGLAKGDTHEYKLEQRIECVDSEGHPDPYILNGTPVSATVGEVGGIVTGAKNVERRHLARGLLIRRKHPGGAGRDPRHRAIHYGDCLRGFLQPHLAGHGSAVRRPRLFHRRGRIVFLSNPGTRRRRRRARLHELVLFHDRLRRAGKFRGLCQKRSGFRGQLRIGRVISLLSAIDFRSRGPDRYRQSEGAACHRGPGRPDRQGQHPEHPRGSRHAAPRWRRNRRRRQPIFLQKHPVRGRKPPDGQEHRHEQSCGGKQRFRRALSRPHGLFPFHEFRRVRAPHIRQSGHARNHAGRRLRRKRRRSPRDRRKQSRHRQHLQRGRVHPARPGHEQFHPGKQRRPSGRSFQRLPRRRHRPGLGHRDRAGSGVRKPCGKKRRHRLQHGNFARLVRSQRDPGKRAERRQVWHVAQFLPAEHDYGQHLPGKYHQHDARGRI